MKDNTIKGECLTDKNFWKLNYSYKNKKPLMRPVLNTNNNRMVTITPNQMELQIWRNHISHTNQVLKDIISSNKVGLAVKFNDSSLALVLGQCQQTLSSHSR